MLRRSNQAVSFRRIRIAALHRAAGRRARNLAAVASPPFGTARPLVLRSVCIRSNFSRLQHCRAWRPASRVRGQPLCWFPAPCRFGVLDGGGRHRLHCL